MRKIQPFLLTLQALELGALTQMCPALIWAADQELLQAVLVSAVIVAC